MTNPDRIARLQSSIDMERKFMRQAISERAKEYHRKAIYILTREIESEKAKQTKEHK